MAPHAIHHFCKKLWHLRWRSMWGDWNWQRPQVLSFNATRPSSYHSLLLLLQNFQIYCCIFKVRVIFTQIGNFQWLDLRFNEPWIMRYYLNQVILTNSGQYQLTNNSFETERSMSCHYQFVRKKNLDAPTDHVFSNISWEPFLLINICRIESITIYGKILQSDRIISL